MPPREAWISVDVETSGPTPSTGSLIALGACLVSRPDATFYREIQPIPSLPWSAAAERIHRLDRARLAEQGQLPHLAMQEFGRWIASLPEVRAGDAPVFVGYNAPFDWMFVADYFHRFTGDNPFGIGAPDLKSIYLGKHHREVRTWKEASLRYIRARYPSPPGIANTHNALDDARAQAQLCRAILGLEPRR